MWRRIEWARSRTVSWRVTIFFSTIPKLHMDIPFIIPTNVPNQTRTQEWSPSTIERVDELSSFLSINNTSSNQKYRQRINTKRAIRRVWRFNFEASSQLEEHSSWFSGEYSSGQYRNRKARKKAEAISKTRTKNRITAWLWQRRRLLHVQMHHHPLQ